MPEPPLGSLGWQLREMRKKRRLTIEELAAAAGVGVTTISELERGTTLCPQRATTRKLSDALRLSGDELADFEAAARRDAPVGGRVRSASSSQRATRDVSDAVVPSASGLAAAQGTATRTLPYRVRSFTGREDELGELADALSDANRTGIYVIEGMPGVGKTSLAVQAAYQAARSFPDGQLFIDLHGYTRGLRPLSPQEALRSLLHNCLGMPNEVIPRKLDERAAVYRSLLAGTRTLILLDNAASAAQVRPLLPGGPGCSVIVTSRKSLRALDDVESLGLGTLREDEAIALFRKTAGPERVPADDPDLPRIVQLCEGLPLAVRMMAAWMRRRPLLTTGEALEQLRDEHQRLARLESEDLSVRAAFELSYSRLPVADQRMFRRLGLIPGLDFDAYAAASLAGGDSWRLLESLLDHNLLIQQARGRYRLHDLIRAYARSLAAEEAAAVYGRLLDFYLGAAQAADVHFEWRSPRVNHARPVAASVSLPPLGTAEQARAWVGMELANLDAAARHAVKAGRPDFTIALSMALSQYLRVYGPWPQGLLLHRLAYGMARERGDSQGQAAALVHIGVLQRQLGELRAAKAMLDRAANLYRKLGDRRGLAAALLELGVVKRLSGTAKDSGRDLAEALKLYQELGDRHGEAGARAELGGLRRQTSEFEAAQESLHRALSLFRSLGMRYGEAVTLGYLGSVQRTTGAIEDARESLGGALAIYRERGEPIGQANILLLLGGVYMDAELLEEAASALAEARGLYEAAGYRRGLAGALTYLGDVQQRTGQWEAAEQSLSQALELFREVDDPGGEVETLNHYAVLAIVKGERKEALARYAQALEIARRIDSPKDEADALDGIARVHLFADDVSQASAFYQRALDLYRSMHCDADAERVRQALSSIQDDPDDQEP